MFFALCALVTCFTYHTTHGMYGLMPSHNATEATQNARSAPSSLCHRQRTMPEPTCLITVNHALPGPIITALNTHDTKAVKAHFNTQLDFITSRKQLVQALLIAAKQQPAHNQDIISYLLGEIIPHHLSDIECIVHAAARSGQTRIIEYLSNHGHKTIISVYLVQAIIENNPRATKTLLAGIDANYRSFAQQIPAFITIAIQKGTPLCVRELVAAGAFVQEQHTRDKSPLNAAFTLYTEEKSNSDDQQCRLEVIKELFKGIPENEINAELAKQLATVDTRFHKNITNAIHENLQPERLCMDENITTLKAENQELSQELACKNGCINGFAASIVVGILCRCAFARNQQLNQP